MLKSILAVVMVIMLVLSCLPAWALDKKGPEDAPDSQFKMNAERIGGLRLGLPAKEVSGFISCNVVKGKEILEGATGEYVQTWKYPECGIEFKMGSGRRGGAKAIESITIASPSDLATGRGIRIGSTEEEVSKAYGRYRDNEMSAKGKEFVAGSIYGGMIFHFKNGKVVKIFLGAAAE